MKSITKSNSFKVISRLLIVLVVIGLISASTFFYLKYKQATGDSTQETEAQEIAAILSDRILLPDEEPALATITDKEQLSGQSFFDQAENDDKVLIYFKAGKAILYRPSIDKIIDITKITKNISEQSGIEQVADLGTGSEQVEFAANTPVPQTPTPTATPQPSATPTPVDNRTTVTIKNGTTVGGLAGVVEGRVGANTEDFVVVSTGNANRTDYAKTIVVDISKQKSSQAEELASLVSGIVFSLPEGEVSPATDFLIIAGKDSAE